MRSTREIGLLNPALRSIKGAGCFVVSNSILLIKQAWDQLSGETSLGRANTEAHCTINAANSGSQPEEIMSSFIL